MGETLDYNHARVTTPSNEGTLGKTQLLNIGFRSLTGLSPLQCFRVGAYPKLIGRSRHSKAKWGFNHLFAFVCFAYQSSGLVSSGP